MDCKTTKEIADFITPPNRYGKSYKAYRCSSCREIKMVSDKKSALHYKKLNKSKTKPTITSKVCSQCKVEKLADSFSKASDQPTGIRSECKACNSAKQRDQRVREVQMKSRIRRKYNISPELYLQILEDQGHKCAICSEDLYSILSLKNPGGKTAVVDHCHKSLKVRGILCDLCNNGIGRFKDSIEIMQRAINYLESSNESST